MIAPEVIEIIIGITASKVEDVYGVRGTFASNVTELLGRATHGKSACLASEGDGLRVDPYCHLGYGVSVSEVAMGMQGQVSQQVLFIMDIDLFEVNVHIVAVVPEKSEQPATKGLSEDGEEENE